MILWENWVHISYHVPEVLWRWQRPLFYHLHKTWNQMHLTEVSCTNWADLKQSWACICFFDFSIDDNRTVFAKNVNYILKCCGKGKQQFHNITKSIVAEHVKYYDRNVEETYWKVEIGNELLKFRSGDLYIEGFYKSEIEEILRYVCISWSIPINTLIYFLNS